MSMNIGYGLEIGYESSAHDLEIISNAIDRYRTKSFRKIVLFVNKAGLLQYMRFGSRAK